MLFKRSSMSVLSTIVVMSALGAGCAAKEDSPGGEAAGNAGTSGAGGSGAGGTGNSPTGGTGGTGGSGTGGAGGSVSGTGGASGGGSGMSGAGAGGTGTATEMTKEELFPDVQDWAALDVIYDTAYSAYDGEHTFQVPFHVQDSTVALADWFAIPADAVSFDEDPDLAEDGGGVLVTVLADVPEITIGVHSGMLGGTAPLHITSGTPESWEMGRARYDNGVDYELPDLTPEMFAMLLLDPNYMIPSPEPNTSCKTCHSTGAKYFEIQHTPTQAARFSDEDLKMILTTGTKPDGIGFRVLPDMLGDKTNVEIYAEFHKWEAGDEEIKGLLLYLRSLTPTGQGDIKLPDGTYVEPGTMPPPP